MKTLGQTNVNNTYKSEIGINYIYKRAGKVSLNYSYFVVQILRRTLSFLRKEDLSKLANNHCFPHPGQQLLCPYFHIPFLKIPHQL